MGDWFLGLVTGIILTAVVGWACLRRRFIVTWTGYTEKDSGAKNSGESSDHHQDDDQSRSIDD
jgi:hypothetical protein